MISVLQLKKSLAHESIGAIEEASSQDIFCLTKGSKCKQLTKVSTAIKEKEKAHML